MKRENGVGFKGILIPAIIMGTAATSLASGGGYGQICVTNSDSTIQCVKTNRVEKYINSLGVRGLRMPNATFDVEPGESAALLVCDEGTTHPIGVDPANVVASTADSAVYQFETAPFACAPPKVPTKLYGPADGDSFCNGRGSMDGCKDCCLTVAALYTGAVAGTGVQVRAVAKITPKLIMVELALEGILYGLIYYNRFTCNDNCEITYEAKERRLP
mgnify:CR=1 FL=1